MKRSHHAAGGFEGVPRAPVFGQEPPADFHAGRERRVKGHPRKPGEPGEISGGFVFHGPERKAVLRLMCLNSGQKCVAFGFGECGRENFMTRGSAFIRRKAARSASVQRRTRRRSVTRGKV